MTNGNLVNIVKAVIRAIEKRKMKDAYELLEIFYGHLNCNCVIREIDKMVNGNLFTLKEKLLDDEKSYENNVINGFVYLRCKEYERSRHYLTNAIRLNKNNFLAYALRSEIENTEIKLRIKDAEKAVALNPNQRNYFQFARVQSKADSTDQNLRKSIQLYQNAIDLNPRFACAIKNQGILLQQIRDKESIILSCENSLKSNKKHWEREWLCMLYYEEGRFKEAKKHLTYLVKAKPERLDFLYMLAETQENVGEEGNAIYNFYKYYELDQRANIEEKSGRLSYDDLIWKVYELEQVLFEKKKYKEIKELCEKLIKLEGYERWLQRGNLGPSVYLSALLRLNNITKEDVDFYKNYYIDLWKKFFNNTDKSKLTRKEKATAKTEQFDLHKEINFGKYKGMTINDIIIIDLNYLVRTIINSLRFCVADIFFLIEEVKNHPLFYKALTINKAKICFIYERDEEWDRFLNRLDLQFNYYVEPKYKEDWEYERGEEWGGLYGDEAVTGYWNTE